MNVEMGLEGSGVVTYCIVPAHLALQLHEALRRHFHDDPSIEVVVERRGDDRRHRGDRRASEAPASPLLSSERRRIHGLDGRRVADRRATAVMVSAPRLPRRARHHADLIVFVERIEPSELEVEDADTARLVVGFQAGDRSAFDLLYLRYFNRIYGYLHVVLSDAAAAEDATQQVFVRALEALPRYERRSTPFRGWLFTIVRNHAVTQLARARRVEPIDPHDLHVYEQAGHHESGLPALDWISDRELMLFVERLPLVQRQVLLLRFLLDLSPSQIGEILDRSPQEVRKLQYRAISFLRARLTAVGRVPHGQRRAGWQRRVTQVAVLRERRFALGRQRSPAR
jgi:RNA polymerase sigma-70 factor (ECF subfamily)